MNISMLISTILSGIFFLLGVFGLFLREQKKPLSKKNSTIFANAKTFRYSKWLSVLAIILSICSVALCAYSSTYKLSYYICVLTAPCLFGSACLLLSFFRYRIRLVQRVFEIRRVFWPPRIYAIRDVAGIDNKKTCTKVYMKNGIVLRFDPMLQGYSELISVLKRNPNNKKNGTPFVKNQVFHGYIKNGKEIISGIIIMTVFVVIVIGFIVYSIIAQSPSVNQKTQKPIILNAYTVSWEADNLTLDVPSIHQTLYIDNLTDGLSDVRLSKLYDTLDKNEQITVFISRNAMDESNDEKNGFISIAAIYNADGTVLLSHSEANHAYWCSNAVGFLYIVLILFPYFLFIWYYCYIVNHAPEHPIAFKALVEQRFRNI